MAGTKQVKKSQKQVLVEQHEHAKKQTTYWFERADSLYTKRDESDVMTTRLYYQKQAGVAIRHATQWENTTRDLANKIAKFELTAGGKVALIQ